LKTRLELKLVRSEARDLPALVHILKYCKNHLKHYVVMIKKLDEGLRTNPKKKQDLINSLNLE
jgi:hypothetical protein